MSTHITQAIIAVASLAVLTATLLVNRRMAESNHRLAEVARAQAENDTPRLTIHEVKLYADLAYVTICNRGGRDGAVLEIYTTRQGMTGEIETYPLRIWDPLVIEANDTGHGEEPVDYMVRSGDRRRFLCRPGKIRRYIEGTPVESPRRPGIEPWFGTDTGPATLNVEPVFGVGDRKAMPVHFGDGAPARE